MSRLRKGLVVKGAIGAGVLFLATGAASAASTTSSVDVLRTQLQARWGTDVVRSVDAIPNSNAVLVGTRDQSLLRSANPQRWLGAGTTVVVMFVRPPGSTHTTIDNKCASTTEIPMMEDFRD